MLVLAGCGDLEWTRMQARMGNADAEAELGRRYEQGDGVRQNGMRAASWYRRAAKQGHLDAKVALARLHERGFGVEADPGTAARLLEEPGRRAMLDQRLTSDHGDATTMPSG